METKVIVNMTNVHRDERNKLLKYLEINCWEHKIITGEQDRNGINT